MSRKFIYDDEFYPKAILTEQQIEDEKSYFQKSIDEFLVAKL